MKDSSFACKRELGNLVMVLGAKNNGKANLSVAVSDDLTERLNAGAIIREISKEIKEVEVVRPFLPQPAVKTLKDSKMLLRK